MKRKYRSGNDNERRGIYGVFFGSDNFRLTSMVKEGESWKAPQKRELMKSMGVGH